jgi:hypothetical protein
VSPEVSCYAIRSACKLKKTEHLSAIIQKLDNPRTHDDAVSALMVYGHSAMDELEAFLENSETQIQLRIAVVRVLASIGSEDAARVLLKELEETTDELETEIVDALDRIRSEQEDMDFPGKLTQRVTRSIIKKYCQTFIDLTQLDPSEENREQRSLIEKKLGIFFWDIFRLLGLYYPHEDIVKARQNIKTGTPDSVAYAIELLDNNLKKDMKDFVIPLVEDLPPLQKKQKFLKMLKKL